MNLTIESRDDRREIEMKATPYYAEKISQVIPKLSEDAIYEVEELMRDHHPTLNHLTARELRDLIRTAYREYKQMQIWKCLKALNR